MRDRKRMKGCTETENLGRKSGRLGEEGKQDTGKRTFGAEHMPSKQAKATELGFGPVGAFLHMRKC